MSKLSRLPLLLVLLLLGLVASGCSTGSDDADAEETAPPDPVVSDDGTDTQDGNGERDHGQSATDQDPDAAEDPSDPASDPASDSGDGDTDIGLDTPEVAVYFVRSHDSGTWVEPERHALDGPTKAVARGAMTLLFGGTDPYDPELTSEAPAEVRVLATNIRNRVLIVDVSDAITDRGAGSAQEIAFAQQFAHTGAAFDTVDSVELWIEGEPVDELWGHLDWSQPIAPDPFALSPVTITEPAMHRDGATARVGEVVLRGEATVFEATVGIRVHGPDGDLVVEDFTTATEGAPGRGTWDYRVTLDEPGAYTVEASEDDPSGGEGRPPFVTTRVIDVR
jgi:hypothetical protein